MKKQNEETKNAENLIKTVIETGCTISDLRKIKSEELEAIYGVGFELYKAGRYKDAFKIFQFLCLIDHLTQKYWLALGGTLQMMKNYLKAIEIYGMATMLDLEDPRPSLRAGQCFMALGDKASAIGALNTAITFGQNNQKFATDAAQAKALLAMLTKGEQKEKSK